MSKRAYTLKCISYDTHRVVAFGGRKCGWKGTRMEYVLEIPKSHSNCVMLLVSGLEMAS